MSSDPADRLEEVQGKLNARRAALQERIDSVVNESGGHDLPPLEDLKEERARLMQAIQHSKDEGDAIMRELEGNEEAAKLYRVAARVQRYEKFTERAEVYVQKELPGEIENIAEADKRHSEDEVAGYITELQTKREDELKKIATLKERTSSRARSIRNGPKVERGAKNARRMSEAKEEELAKEDQQTVAFTAEQRDGNAGALAKVRALREERSKLQVQILDERHRGEKKVVELNTRIRHADLANKSDARRCGELNTSNAALTTNSQFLMGQLNGEHYGVEGGPTQKALIKMRRDEEKRAAKQRATRRPENNGDGEGDEGDEDGAAGKRNHDGLPPTHGGYNRTDSRMTENSNVASGVSSRRQSLSKPPLVALKPTAAQRSREAAVKAEMEHRREEEESVQRSHRRGSDASASAQRPPRVASIQTESSRNRAASREHSISSRRDN